MSTIVAKTPLPTAAAVAGVVRRWWWLAAAFVLVYGSILSTLAGEWWTNEDYAHGLFTPFAVAYLIYERREDLLRITAEPAGFGFVVILASQALLAVGFLGAEFFLQRVSLLMFLAGLILFLLGWRALSKLAFGLILLFLAIPLPALIFNAVALPLQLLASTLAESALDMMRIPVFREGNVLQLPHQLLLNVEEACSGIRSLVSLIALAALTTMLARFLPMRWWARAVFILSAVPIALAANALRVTGTALLAHKFGESAAQGFFHSFSGALVFAAAFVALLVEMILLQSFAAHGKKAES